MRDTVEAGRALVGPPHLIGEVANALYQRVRSREPVRHLTDEEARDSLYVVLAQILGADLWIADRRLLAAVGPIAPWVRFISRAKFPAGSVMPNIRQSRAAALCVLSQGGVC